MASDWTRHQPRGPRLPFVLAFLARLAPAALGLAIGALVTGCALRSDITLTQPPAVTQLLLFRSLERAVAQLDVSRFVGRRVSVDLISQVKDDGFVKRYLVDWLKEHKVQVVTEHPDLKLDVMAAVLGTDHGQTLLGIPSLQTTLFPVATPEIAFFKWDRHRGRTDLQIYAFDPASDTFLEKSPTVVGHSKQDDYTVLIIIGFTVSDLEKPPPSPTP